MAVRTTKYSHIIPSLPRLDVVAPDRRTLLDSVKEEITKPLNPDEELLTPKEIQESRHACDLNIQMLLQDLKRTTEGARAAAVFTRGYVNVRSLMDQIDEWKSSTQLLLEAYESLMVDQMEAEGVASIRLDSGASVSTFMEPYSSVADKELFRQWCVAPEDKCMVCGNPEHSPSDHDFKRGGGFEKQLQLWPSTMNAITKERLLRGEPAPDGVEVFAKTMIRLTKG